MSHPPHSEEPGTEFRDPVPDPKATSVRESPVSAARFSLGNLYATPNAIAHVSPSEASIALDRHLRGDWGDLDPEDTAANNEALLVGARLLSAYKTSGGTNFWIITEADRSSTTILLPEDY